MRVEGKDYRTVWMEGNTVKMIEQNLLPFEFTIVNCADYRQTCRAIKTMVVRGAGAIGAAAGFAMAQAIAEYCPDQKAIEKARHEIESTRPTARNLFYAVERVFACACNADLAKDEAQRIANEDAGASQKIGYFGEPLIADAMGILTHCNAGWLAFVDFGTALSPIYTAQRKGKKILVYADETRPRSQGARLTAWELAQENVPFYIIPDNAAAHLMSLGKIQLVITGADRIAANGDTANKIGTLEKAIAAKAFGIPFYVAAPSSTFDLHCSSGKKILIEERPQEEVLFQTGPDKTGLMHTILVASPGAQALNPAFDITPAEYISGFITEKGIIKPDASEIQKLFTNVN